MSKYPIGYNIEMDFGIEIEEDEEGELEYVKVNIKIPEDVEEAERSETFSSIQTLEESKGRDTEMDINLYGEGVFYVGSNTIVDL